MKLPILVLCAGFLLISACNAKQAGGAAASADRTKMSQDMRGLIHRQVERYEGLEKDLVQAMQGTTDSDTLLALQQIELSLTRVHYLTAALEPLEEVYLSCPLSEPGARAAIQAEYGKASAATQIVSRTITDVTGVISGRTALQATVTVITSTALEVLKNHGEVLAARYQRLATPDIGF
jgi:hypothetical protein